MGLLYGSFVVRKGIVRARVQRKKPVIHYYANVGGGAQRAVVFGFRTKVEF
jgi:hypothetical protein